MVLKFFLTNCNIPSTFILSTQDKQIAFKYKPVGKTEIEITKDEYAKAFKALPQTEGKNKLLESIKRVLNKQTK